MNQITVRLTTLRSAPGCKLTSFGSSCFFQSNITFISLPQNIEEIGNKCFYGTKIDEIVFPKSIQTIKASAFETAPITRIIFEEDSNLTYIASKAFRGNKISKITFPSGLTILEASAFSKCTLLSEIEFEFGCQLVEIPSNTFEGCILLESFPIIPSIKAIDASAFTGCFSLTIFTIEEPSKSYFTFVESGLYNKSLSSLYVFPPGVKSGRVIPDAIEIRSNAFYGDNLLENLSFEEGSQVQSFGKDTFYGCSSLKSLIIPSSLQEISDGCFKSCTGLSYITFRDGSRLQSIGSSTFEGCKKLAVIEFGEGSQLEQIGESTFKDCINLLKIKFPPNIKSIGSSAFSECTSLETIEFDNQRTNKEKIDIPSLCFAKCSNMITANLPSFVRSVGADAFVECNSLSYLILQEGIELIGDRAFMGCGLPHVDLPSSVCEIGSQAFSSSAGLRSVIVRCQKGLSLKLHCFSFCERLINVSFCATEKIESESPIFQGSKHVCIYGMKLYPSDKIGGASVFRVMDYCMVYPSIPFTSELACKNQCGFLIASMIDSAECK